MTRNKIRIRQIYGRVILFKIFLQEYWRERTRVKHVGEDFLLKNSRDRIWNLLTDLRPEINHTIRDVFISASPVIRENFNNKKVRALHMRI